MGSAVSSSVGPGAKPQPPTILVHFEDLETLLMTSKMCIVLRTICPPMLIRALTELMEFLYISCRKNLPHPLSAPPLLAPGGTCPLHPTPTTVSLCVCLVLLFVLVIQCDCHWNELKATYLLIFYLQECFSGGILFIIPQRTAEPNDGVYGLRK